MENIKIKVKNLTDFSEIEPDSILITYSDHYRGNSGDDIYLTNNQGKDRSGWFENLHMNISPDDRGIISMVSLTSELGPFDLYLGFKDLCQFYVNASKALKDWDNGEYVFTFCNKEEYINNGSNSFYGCRNDLRFEESSWYKRCHKRSKPETIDRKKVEFFQKKEKYNKDIRNLLEENKLSARRWFNENGISVRIAYKFIEGYIR